MNPDSLEKLFLLEFLIDHVCIYNSKLELTEDVLLQLGPIIIKFQFLNYPTIEVYEEDFTSNTKPLLSDEKRIYFKSGRSCMFSMNSTESMLLNDPGLDLKLSVYRRPIKTYICQDNNNNELNNNEDYLIGNTRVILSDIFKALFEKTTNESSTAKMSHTKTAAHKLLNIYGNEVGRIVFLIRVSCFGYMVVTGFQLSEEDKKNFKIKNFGIHQSFNIKHTIPIDKICDLISKDDTEPSEFKGIPVVKQPKKIPTKSHDKPKKHKDEKSKKKQTKTITEKCPYGFPKSCCPCKRKPICCPCQGQLQQQNIMQQNQGLFNQYQQGLSITNPYSSISYPVAPNQSCDQSQGQYQSLQIPQQQIPILNQPTTPNTVSPTNQYKDMDIEPGAVGIRGNQLVFRMPDKQNVDRLPMENKFASSVYYKMNGENDEAARNVIQVVPEKSKCIPEQIPNDKQDVFVLKLGKKRMAAGKKPKLELELKTPKMKEEKPETETQSTQYSESDIPKPPKPPKPPKSPKSKPNTADSKKKKK